MYVQIYSGGHGLFVPLAGSASCGRAHGGLEMVRWSDGVPSARNHPHAARNTSTRENPQGRGSLGGPLARIPVPRPTAGAATAPAPAVGHNYNRPCKHRDPAGPGWVCGLGILSIRLAPELERNAHHDRFICACVYVRIYVCIMVCMRAHIMRMHAHMYACICACIWGVGQWAGPCPAWRDFRQHMLFHRIHLPIYREAGLWRRPIRTGTAPPHGHGHNVVTCQSILNATRWPGTC